MTNREYREKYPIGTKIRYIGNEHVLPKAKKDIGKYGTIVGYYDFEKPNIYLPESTHIASVSTPGVPVTWGTTWRKIKILPRKNEQMLFSFMED